MSYYTRTTTYCVDDSTGTALSSGVIIRQQFGGSPSGVSKLLTLNGDTNDAPSSTSANQKVYYKYFELSEDYEFVKWECYCSELGSSIRTQYFTTNPTDAWNLSSVIINHQGTGNRLKLVVTLHVRPKAKYNITYNLDGGSGGPESAEVEEGNSYTIPDTIPIKDGFAFGAWKDIVSLIEYQPADTIENIQSDIELLAIWTISPGPTPGPTPSKGQALCYFDGPLAFHPQLGSLVYG